MSVITSSAPCASGHRKAKQSLKATAALVAVMAIPVPLNAFPIALGGPALTFTPELPKVGTGADAAIITGPDFSLFSIRDVTSAPPTAPNQPRQTASLRTRGILQLQDFYYQGIVTGQRVVGAELEPGPPADVALFLAMQRAHRAHTRIWGEPKSSIQLGNKSVFFQLTPPSWKESGLAYWGNLRATPLLSRSVCSRPESSGPWCTNDGLSVFYYSEAARNINNFMLISHEFVHAKQYEWLGAASANLPFWMLEGQANGWGYGLVESGVGTRQAIAQRYATATPTPDKPYEHKLLAFMLGLRYYDQPLNVDSFISTYPKTHPVYPLSGTPNLACQDVGLLDTNGCSAGVRTRDALAHITMASYSTGSFFRTMLRKRPAGAVAIQHMMKQEPPSSRNLEAWLNWLDEGLKSATYSEGGVPDAKIWRRGIRDVLNETIVEIADLPDTELKSRNGQLATIPYDARIWSQGCKEIDLTTATTFTDTVTIQPLAARCYRVKLNADATRRNTNSIELQPTRSPTTPPIQVQVAPQVLSVTMSSTQDRLACGDLDMGSRGQIIPVPLMWDLRGTPQGTCMVSWPLPYMPLNVSDPNGLGGYQNIVFINANTIAINTQTQTFTLEVSRPVASGEVSGQARPSGGGQPRRLPPIPRDGGQLPPSSGGGARSEATDPNEDCAPEARAIFECGPVTEFEFGYGQAATESNDLAIRMVGQTLGWQQTKIGNEGNGYPSIADELSSDLTQLTAQVSRQMMAGARSPGGRVEIKMPRLQPGQTGTFDARVELSWSDGTRDGDGTNTSLAPNRTVSANNCIVVETYKTDAKVTISANTLGFMQGSFTANLYEDEEDEQLRCRNPRPKIGTITMAFTTAGNISTGEFGTHTINNDQNGILTHAQIQADISVQAMMALEKRSDLVEEFTVPTTAGRRPNGARPNGNGTNVGPNGRGGESAITGAPQCPVALTGANYQDFVNAVIAGMDPEDLPSVEAYPAMREQMLSMARSVLNPQVCAWVQAGRPRRWSLPKTE